jgi:ABC-type transport system involved in multi-copper enzyme maturation permease subunit
MSTTLEIARFEFLARVRQKSTWVYFLIFLSLAMLWIAAAGGMFKDANISFGSGKVWVNSPFALATTVAFLGIFGLTVMSAIMGRAVQQDAEYSTEHFFFTAPINKAQYLGGRFIGAFGVGLVVFSSIALGAWLATLLPGMDAERLGPNSLAAYLWPYAIMQFPNMLLIGGIFFTLAASTRRMLPVYVGGVVLLIGWLLATQLLRDIDNKLLGALLDPFGLSALTRLTEYWTVAERKSRLVPFEGYLLWNRLLWLAVTSTLMTGCYARFSFSTHAAKVSAPVDEAVAAPEQVSSVPRSATAIASQARSSSPAPLRLLPALVRLNFVETVKNIYFGVLVLAGLLFMIFASTTLGEQYGTPTWPVTFQVMGLVSGSFGLFMLIIITFYSGELMWREREARLDQIVDATPVPTWVPMLAKLLALMLVPVVLQAMLMLCGMGIQLVKGYTHLQPLLYLQQLFGLDLIDYWLVCALAVAVHSVVNNKYVGHVVMILYYITVAFASQLGLEHNLLKYGAVPTATYSDINGYGHFLFRARMFEAYWGACALLLLVLAYLMWTRGTVAGWRERLAVARSRATLPVLAAGAAATLAFGALGGFIYYNTNILNTYRSSYDESAVRADYEKTWKSWADTPQPKVTAVTINVALTPSRQLLRATGNYALVNRSAAPIEEVMLNFMQGKAQHVHQLEFGLPAQLLEVSPTGEVRRYKFDTPLAPGATTTLSFDLESPTPGFQNEGSNTHVVYNGSFINNTEFLPLIGYQPDAELERDQDRKKFGLAPRERMPDRDDVKAQATNYISNFADWIAFDATVSTEPDQIAVAPGYLQREWTEGEGAQARRFFHYKMDIPILNFFAFQSGRYAVRKDVWHDTTASGKPPRDVAIEVYYQPGHEFNLDSMIASSKAALEYFSRHFGPYQHQQFRIIEFPRYATFAQSFPNTIPYSEGIGFIARVDPYDPKSVDYPYFVTAHEAAHQWWAHQVIGARAQGGTMLSESFAEYSALMVLKHRYGDAHMRKFLGYELDGYLRGRAFEQKKELPLARVENQAYIHYRKGSLVMYALQDLIGEDKVNGVLRKLRDETAYQGPPYPNATRFVQLLREAVPAEQQYVVDDWFESIVLYDNRAVKASAKAIDGGRWEVTLSTLTKKLRADELGKEQEVPFDDFIEIGVLSANDEIIKLEKRRIHQEQNSFTLVVSEKPGKAGIDPMNKLIDRKPKDNVLKVEMQ